MSLTKKHFEGIAETLRPYTQLDGYKIALLEIRGEGREWSHADTARAIVSSMARYLETQNPHFDRERFLTAAGYYPEVRSERSGDNASGGEARS